jgi:hypothetical protein
MGKLTVLGNHWEFGVFMESDVFTWARWKAEEVEGR